MSDPPNEKEREERELREPVDYTAAAIEPTYSREEPPAVRDDTSDSVINEKLGEDDKVSRRSATDDDNDAIAGPTDSSRPDGLTATRSYATDTSVASRREVVPQKPTDRPWYKKLNPLRWGEIPQIPEERIVSRESQAGFWSQLTFSWMTPLMTVSFPVAGICSISCGCAAWRPGDQCLTLTEFMDESGA